MTAIETPAAPGVSRERVRNTILWAAQILLMVSFAVAGGNELVGLRREMADDLETQLRQSVRHLGGMLRLVGAIGR